MTVKSKKLVSLASVCFYIFWITLMVGKGLGFTNEDIIFRYMTFAGMPFIVAKFILTRWEKREFILCVSLNILGIAVWIFSKDTGILLAIITITACKNINLYQLFRITLWIRGTMFILRTSLAVLGVIDIQYRPRYASATVFDIRYALGYGQPNATNYTLFIIIALILILYHKRMKLYHYIIMFVYNLFIFHYTNSRTGLILIIFVLAMAYLIDRKYSSLLKALIKKFGKYVYIMGAICGLMICLLSDKLPKSRALGTLFSRFRTGGAVMRNSRITLFGIPNIVTDFGYIVILYGCGIIIFILFLTGMTILLKKFEKSDRYIEQIVLITYAFYTVSEAYTNSILMNIGLLFLAVLIYPHNEETLLLIPTPKS